MTIVPRRDRVGTTRLKLTLVGVLAVVLVGVIYVQLPESEGVDDTAISIQRKTLVPRPLLTGKSTVRASTKRPQLSKDSSTQPKDTTQGFDPLAPPVWYMEIIETMQAAADEVPQMESNPPEELVLKELQESGAAIVLISGEAQVAAVGQYQLRIGDRVEDYRVSEITEEGVVLTRTADE